VEWRLTESKSVDLCYLHRNASLASTLKLTGLKAVAHHIDMFQEMVVSEKKRGSWKIKDYETYVQQYLNGCPCQLEEAVPRSTHEYMQHELASDPEVWNAVNALMSLQSASVSMIVN
jgi:hypothetical protein